MSNMPRTLPTKKKKKLVNAIGAGTFYCCAAGLWSIQHTAAAGRKRRPAEGVGWDGVRRGYIPFAAPKMELPAAREARDKTSFIRYIPSPLPPPPSPKTQTNTKAKEIPYFYHIKKSGRRLNVREKNLTVVHIMGKV